MKKVKIATLLLSATALLAACGSGNNGGSSATDSNGSSIASVIESSQTGTSSSTVTTYNIVDRTGDGVTVTLDKTKAAKGETVTATVAVSEGFILESLKANDTACTKVNDTTYTFVMPDQSVVLTSVLTVTGDAIVTGDLAAALEEQADGTFKGTVTATVDSKIKVKVGSVEYGYGGVNFDRSFADISDASPFGFRVGGNGVYEITFDASLGKNPVIVKRVGFVHAPQDASELASAFNGDYAGRNVNDGGAYNITNLKKATYRSSRSAVKYEWNRYADNSSLAIVTNLADEEQSAVVYKKLTDTNFQVVDTYVEAGKDISGNYFDDSMREDTTKFSADYEVVSNVTNSNYQIDAFNASRQVMTPSHNMHSVDRDMHYGYRTGFTVEDNVKAVSRVFNGTKNDDGSYTTTVKSWKNYQDSNAVHTRKSYEITVTFNADSTVKSGSYKEYAWTEANWSFNDSDVENGGSAKDGQTGNLIQSSSYSYEYGTEFAASPTFDTTSYFISSIDSVDVTSEGLEANKIQEKATVDDWRNPQRNSIKTDSYGYSSLVNMTFSPSTALNRWQYGVVASSNEKVVGPRTSGAYGWEALNKGESTLTISGHTPGTASKTVAVSVVNGVKPRNYYFMAAAGYENDFVNANSVAVTAGQKTAVRLVISPVNANYNPTITASNPNLKLTLENDYDTSSNAYYTAKILHIDATAMTNTAAENVVLTVTDNFDTSYNTANKSTLYVNVAARPNAVLWPTSLAGTTWSSDKKKTTDAGTDATLFKNATIKFTDTDITIQKASYKKAILNVEGIDVLANYEMGYTYNPATAAITFKGTTANTDWDFVLVACKVDATAGTFGFALSYQVISDYTAGADGIDTYDALGRAVDDFDESGYITEYVTFVRN